jgi:predicted unusual protein kinase regulating ubiquinone biosynthesis (AarF/ABC1/UbiB family)
MLADGGERLALIDLGMVAYVPPRLRERLFQLVLAVVDARGEHVARLCASIGTRLEGYDDAEFVRACGRLIAQYDAQDTLDRRPAGTLLQQVTQLGAACGLRPPREMPLLAKTLMNVENVARTLAPGLDAKDVVRSHMHEVLTRQILSSLSPSRLGAELIEMHELVRDLPQRAHALLRNLSDNRFRVTIGGLEETQLVENLQKIANRITAGVITASLVIGAALTMRVETAQTLWGYPAIALVMFLIASLFGVVLVVQALRRDRKAPPKDETTPI